MKKTKCDGESPCKRCKDDGLVCTAGSRKKTEFKQLPRGYAEVLENTQYALIATVQKLYTMLRNNETWDLGEPEINDRGQPVIHDIASKLGCIRPSPDLPYAFPEGAEDFAELQVQLQAARSEMASEDTGSRKLSEESQCSPLTRTERASSSESEHSTLSKDYNQLMWSQQQQQAISQADIKPAITSHTTTLAISQPQPQTQLPNSQRQSFDDDYRPRTSFDTTASIPSPIYTDFQAPNSPTFRNSSPFSPWPNDDFLSPAHALDLTAHYMRVQNAQLPSIHRSNPNSMGDSQGLGLEADIMKAMQLNCGGMGDCVNFVEGTIRPGMLDCSTGIDFGDQMGDIMFAGEFEGQGMRMG
jgi:hypothetical protein